MNLTELRGEMDAINRQLLDLLAKRMELSQTIGDYKRSQGLPISDPEREQASIRQAEEVAGPFLAPAVGSLFQLLFALSRARQNLLRAALSDKIASFSQSGSKIALIGMPGVGKTTVGRILAHASGLSFFDTDEWILKTQGQTPEELLLTRGQDAFRALETKALEEGLRQATVIATGGGIVTIPQNICLLKTCSRVVYLTRPLSQLATSHRPITQSAGLAALLAQREPLYQAASNLVVENLYADDAAAEILRSLP